MNKEINNSTAAGKKCEWNSPLKEVQNLVIRAPSVNKWEHNEHKFVWKYHKEEG